MDKDDCPMSTNRCKFDIDLDEELRALKKSRQPASIDAENMDALVSSSRSHWDVSSVKIRVCDREHDRQRSRDSDADNRSTIACLKREIAEYREQNAKLCDLVHEQRKKLEKCNAEASGIDLIKERTNVTVTALQKEFRVAQERGVDLESRNRMLIEEREKLEGRVAKAEKRLFEFSTEILRSIGLDDVVKSDGYDKVIANLRDWFRDYTVLRGKHASVTAELKKQEDEIKQLKSTIESLMKEISGKNVYKEKHDALLKDMEALKLAKTEDEKGIELLKAKLNTAQNEMQQTSKQLEERTAIASKLDVDRRQEASNAKNFEIQFSAFKQSLAAMLSDPYSACAAREDDIKDRIRELQQMQKEKSQSYTSVEDRIKELTKKFEQQYELHHVAEKKVRDAEREIQKLQEKIAASERELGAGDVFRDSLKDERVKCQKAIARIAKALRIEKDCIELEGVEVISDAIIRRIEKLLSKRSHLHVTDDFDESAPRVQFNVEAESACSLKRRLAKAKEQLEAKETHLDLLRKKLAQLEERVHSNRVLDEDEQDAFKRLERRLKKVEEQLEAAKQENAHLKAELLECQNLRLHVLDQDKDIQALERTLEKLERVRQKQALKIVRLKTAIGEVERDIGSDERCSREDKYRSLKSKFDEVKHREKSLKDFRLVVGRMIGLDPINSQVTDAEILTHLERTLRALERASCRTEVLSPSIAESHAEHAEARPHPHRHSQSPSTHDCECEQRVRSGSLSRSRRSKSPVKVDTRQY